MGTKALGNESVLTLATLSSKPEPAVQEKCRYCQGKGRLFFGGRGKESHVGPCLHCKGSGKTT